MPYAFLNPDGTIKQIVPKPTPFMKIGPGERMVQYDPPEVDVEVEDLVVNLPVPEGQLYVTFNKVPKAAGVVAEVWTKRKIDVIQRHMDAKAREKGYDGILSATTYSSSTHPKFGKEGRAYRDWRDACWDKGFEVLAEVQAGTRPMPSDAELIALMPAFTS